MESDDMIGESLTKSEPEWNDDNTAWWSEAQQRWIYPHYPPGFTP